VSLRSRAIDVASIAERFGGGGHRLASGCVLETNLEDARQRVLVAVAAALGASR
jgi:phosphoesterase RecJ-like protein